MKVKIIKPCGDLFPPLYMCPNCKKGHSISYLQDKCDICGVELDWNIDNGTLGRDSDKVETTRPSSEDIKK